MLATERGWRVPRFDPRRHPHHVSDRLRDAVTVTLGLGKYVNAVGIREFEDALAAFLGAADVVSVGNGFDALRLLFELAARGRDAGGPRPSVLTSPLSFPATAAAAAAAGLHVSFGDVNPETHLLDAASLHTEADAGLVAVAPVGIYGQRGCDPAFLEDVPAGAMVVHDGCQELQSLIPPYPKPEFYLGAAVSFFPAKPLGGCGDGGAIVLWNDAPAATLRTLRNHGRPPGSRSDFVVAGCNSRLDSLNAAYLHARLVFADDEYGRRQAVARAYMASLTSIPGLDVPRLQPHHTWHAFPVMLRDKNLLTGFVRLLRSMGIEAVVGYDRPVHLLPPYRCEQSLPIAEDIASRTFLLPISSVMTDVDTEYVISCCEIAACGVERA